MTAVQAALKRDPEAQVLLLVPEINLTPQLEKRVRSRFAEETVVTLHSKLALKERARIGSRFMRGGRGCWWERDLPFSRAL